MEDHGWEDGKIHPRSYPDHPEASEIQTKKDRGFLQKTRLWQVYCLFPSQARKDSPAQSSGRFTKTGGSVTTLIEFWKLRTPLGFMILLKQPLLGGGFKYFFLNLYLGKRSDLTNLFKWVETTNQISCCCLILQDAIGLKTRQVVVVKLPSYTKLFFLFPEKRTDVLNLPLVNGHFSFFKIWTVPFFVWSQTCFILLVVETLIAFPIGS